MTKVEELRSKIDKEIFHTLLIMQTTPGDRDRRRLDIARDLNSLISASHAEGVAEGAAAERERIVRGSERLPEGADAEVSEYFGIAYGVHEDNILANSEIFIVPASLLAPTEQEKITRLAEIVADMSAEESPVEIITRAGSVAPDKEGEK